VVLAPALELILYLFLACLVVRGVFSWIEPIPKNRIHRLTFDVTEPIISPVRRLVPPMGGFDISFVLVFFAVTIVLQLVQRAGV
jgi:YggT family protein